ncbi:N-6 DNA methylase [Luteimicrobium xylanilyticum]|uniref:site-specific DNA-methyltransferase (adenine-specific) n=1 Tax=Luteimicrobium xylanilyticum TaxID=1133546 RepID=A0A5P9QES3_9MICO|nr:N-6 DNA methylase [Luteimicrobium xylanilyticum]QFU99971.1 Site-specific DNA-methyltransferase (adenine-specific) [Luteimicrobium xylanilyticum]
MAVVTFARELGSRGSRTETSTGDPASTTDGAAASVLAGVPAWWRDRARAAGLTGRWLDVFEAIDGPPPPEIVESSPVRLDPELSGHALGHAYVDALSSGVRARHGRHYTPAPIAERLWASARAAWGWAEAPTPLPGLVRDPAAGAGGLLLPPLREHLVATADVDPAVVLAGLRQRIEGLETDPAAAWLGSVVLGAELLPHLAALPDSRRRPLPGLVHLGDGLAAAAPARAVVMNPPYGRVRLDPTDRERFGHLVRGHANLYALFMGHALATLDDDGVLAALVPTSFTAGAYFQPLRAALASATSLRSVSWLADRSGVFSGVLQETCIATFSKAHTDRTDVRSLHRGQDVIARVPTPRTSGPWLLARRREDSATAEAAQKMPHTLGTLGWKVSTGPLVWNRRKDDLASERAVGRLPIVWGADIVTGTVVAHGSRRSVRYLTLRGERDARTMVLDGPAILAQRTTAPEQARRLVVAELDDDVLAEWGGSVVVENHVNVLRPAVPEPVLDRRTLSVVLATTELDRVLRSTAGSVAVSAYELSSLPFPGDETLASWRGLDSHALVDAVRAAYAGAES